MVIDLKYHLTTIIAIFFALGIGILIGSAMIGDDGIVREQQRLISQIEVDLQNLRNQNNQFRVKVSALEGMMVEQEEFIDILFEDAIADKLTGLKGLVIQDPKKTTENSTLELLHTLQAAGMEVTDFVSLPKNWQPVDQTSLWDLCILMTQSVPPGLDVTFQEEQVIRPASKQIASKKGLYQLIKNLSTTTRRVKSGLEGGVPTNDLSFNPGI